MEQQQRYVGRILVDRGALEEARMEELLATAVEKDVPFLDLLFASRELEEQPIVQALADEVGIRFIDDIKPDEVSPELIERVPITFARTHGLLPLEDTGDRVTVAVSNPLDPTPLDDLRALLGKAVEPVAATSEKIEDAINAVYERKADASIGEEHGEEEDEIQDLLDATDEAPVIRWVNNLFYNASRSGASDIHIEPGDKEVVVRNRIDGKLFISKTAPKSALAAIVSRVKIEAGLNIAEKRLPQDGRITKKIQGRLVDVRVSTIPTAKGERIVMRLLDKEKVLLDLTDLGFEGGRLETMNHLVTRPNGIILVTGPTGSGKTTTLYACLSRINSPDRNILTAEDPVEYELPGIGQLQIHPKIGLTFASALRSFLRQDPDVIMVGEIRDHETAEIAIHASLTGHLVLSTLHTNDAAGAVTRMVEMGVQPFLISSSVLGVIAQRLVRRLCRHCRQPYRPSAQDFRSLGVDAARFEALRGAGVQPFRGVTHGRGDGASEGSNGASGANGASESGGSDGAEPETELDVAELSMLAIGDEEDDAFAEQPTRVGPAPTAPTQDALRISEPPAEMSVLNPDRASQVPDGFPDELDRAVFFRAMGCDECSQTGYRGRIAISEMLIIDEPVRREILNQADAATIARTAMGRGMRTLREDGARLVLSGITSLEEVLAATQAGEVD
ncbi:MAG TPA: ATPase, T2SS/T4P/T4SS family [Sandaracinaceae bacterium LLY-WYZ-13_1]|nr:ATPase, T2SS/T4P/T4SS family [Sandaracinaceae bacterium LLY-WYZ-13_1]